MADINIGFDREAYNIVKFNADKNKRSLIAEIRLILEACKNLGIIEFPTENIEAEQKSTPKQ